MNDNHQEITWEEVCEEELLIEAQLAHESEKIAEFMATDEYQQIIQEQEYEQI